MDFRKNINTNGTCRKGYIDANYNQLVKLMGKPIINSCEKVSLEWVIEFEDGEVATVYNWKHHRFNYKGELGIDTKVWNVGGHNDIVVDRVQKLINQI